MELPALTGILFDIYYAVFLLRAHSNIRDSSKETKSIEINENILL